MNVFRFKLFETCRKAEEVRGKEGLSHYSFPEEPFFTTYRKINAIAGKCVIQKIKPINRPFTCLVFY